MAILGHSRNQGHVFWSQWKGDKGSNTIYTIMLPLFLKIPTMYSVIRKIHSFSADYKYSADHSPLLRSAHACSGSAHSLHGRQGYHHHHHHHRLLRRSYIRQVQNRHQRTKSIGYIAIKISRNARTKIR